jgi:O-antigen/teichoic acid export membrane protein
VSRLRTLAKESLAYGVSSLFSRFLNFLLVPFYTHVLTPSAFGVSNILFALIAFLNVIYQAGFDSAYLRLAHDTTEDAERKHLFSTALWSQAGLSLFFSAAFLLSATWLAEVFRVPVAYHDLFPLAAIILALDTLSVVPMAHLRYRHQALHFASIRLGNVIVNVAGNLVFVLYLHQGLRGIFLANAIASLFTLVLLLPILMENLRAVCNGERVRALLRLGLPFMPAGVFGIVNEMSGRFFLVRLSPSDLARLYPGKGWDVNYLTGLFSFAWKLGVFGLLLVQMYRLAWQPFFLRHQREADAPVLFGRVLRILLLFIGVCGLFLMLFLDKLAAFSIHGKMLIAKSFWDGLPIVPGVLLAYALQAWFVHFTLGVYIAKKTVALVWINLTGAVITVALNLLLVPYLGLWGAVWAAVVCYAVMATLMTRKSQSLFPIDLAWRRLLPVMLWLALCFMAGFWVQSNPEIGMGTRFALLVTGLCLPFVLGGITLAEGRIFLKLAKLSR